MVRGTLAFTFFAALIPACTEPLPPATARAPSPRSSTRRPTTPDVGSIPIDYTAANVTEGIVPRPPACPLEASGTTATLHHVWGESANDVWAVGESGLIFHSSGDGNWLTVRTGTEAFYSIWGAGDDLHVIGGGPQFTGPSVWMRSSDHGLTWQSMPTNTSGALITIWGHSSTDFYLRGIGHTTDGGATFTSYVPGDGGFCGFGQDVFTYQQRQVSNSTGDLGTPAHLIHTADAFGTWQEFFFGASDAGAPVSGIWGSAPNDVYVTSLGEPQAQHWDGQSLTQIMFPRVGSDGITGFGANDIWVISGNTVMHLGALGSAPQIRCAVDGESLSNIWASGPHDVYAVGSGGAIVHVKD